jgi:hypothetical protein
MTLTYQTFITIGQGPAYNKRRNYEAKLKQGTDQAQVSSIQQIKQFGENQENPSFEGGFAALSKWLQVIICGHGRA